MLRWDKRVKKGKFESSRQRTNILYGLMDESVLEHDTYSLL